MNEIQLKIKEKLNQAYIELILLLKECKIGFDVADISIDYDDSIGWGHIKINTLYESIYLTFNKFNIDKFGWTIHKMEYKPGCSYMPNGDPGYPDEWDVKILLSPYKEVDTLSGKIEVPTTLNEALKKVVLIIINSRMNFYVGFNEY